MNNPPITTIAAISVLLTFAYTSFLVWLSYRRALARSPRGIVHRIQVAGSHKVKLGNIGGVCVSGQAARCRQPGPRPRLRLLHVGQRRNRSSSLRNEGWRCSGLLRAHPATVVRRGIRGGRSRTHSATSDHPGLCNHAPGRLCRGRGGVEWWLGDPHPRGSRSSSRSDGSLRDRPPGVPGRLGAPISERR